MKILLICCLLDLATHCDHNTNTPHFQKNRNTIVQLFEWKWKDIGDECQRFLQYHNYAAIQISPPSENVVAPGRPWWERYQPVSYQLITRSGDEDDFIDMTKRCSAVGIRIYADVVFNHMTAMNGRGTAGNEARADIKFYPAVPYCNNHFHKTCVITNYNNSVEVRNCQLGGLRDLNQAHPLVRKKIVEYLNHLIDLGVAGFRIDAAKHMWPMDLEAIYCELKYLNTEFGFEPNSKPFIYQEVIDPGNEAISKNEYTPIGAVVEFMYSYVLTSAFRGNSKLARLYDFGPDWGLISNPELAVAFIDNHDNQRNGQALSYKEAKQYKMAVAFMLAHPYGITRIMSSYKFTNKNEGPPMDQNGNIIPPKINSDGTCSNGYVCEHRWRQVYHMVEFREVVKGTNITNWWTDGDQQIAFCRGNKGFIAFSNSGDLNESLQTCLDEGNYCDVISGGVVDGKCSGKMITVGPDGIGFISIYSSEFDGVVAVHIKSKLNRL